ncbi:hypothetical protein Desdi_2548 [Desulfitobacterium dichloroeliminans LMG P-21439]|uniref:Uncharacterized protein n=1 Tax=Desulfitobacterium dichloroeliminans (strain LMG P-21439 / DCA1) TaxID=871963 RepID=L0FAK0_DESDL|nr:hypothetical protein Desdi_2548 [Desulfitobacterium dichloroeliminans LMG P-21439]
MQKISQFVYETVSQLGLPIYVLHSVEENKSVCFRNDKIKLSMRIVSPTNAF